MKQERYQGSIALRYGMGPATNMRPSDSFSGTKVKVTMVNILHLAVKLESDRSISEFMVKMLGLKNSVA